MDVETIQLNNNVSSLNTSAVSNTIFETKRLEKSVSRKLINTSARVAISISLFIILLIPLNEYLKYKYPTLNLLENHYHTHSKQGRKRILQSKKDLLSPRGSTRASSIDKIHKFFNKYIIHFLIFNTAWKQIILWASLVACCSMSYSQGDIINITKRLGRISCALYPTLLALTLRPTPLPRTVYLNLIPVHKWISRTVILTSFIHSGLYLYYFVVTNSLMVKVTKWENFAGLLAMLCFIMIGFTSLKLIRRGNFKIFYFNHYVLTWTSVILLQIHSRPSIKWFTGMNYTILISQIIYRLFCTKWTNKNDVQIVEISNNLSIMEFPRNDIKIKPKYPASHVRINNIHSDNMWKKIWYSVVPLQHPFTLASLPNEDVCKLIIRNGAFPLLNDTPYSITGVYESKIPFFTPPNTQSSNTNNTLFFDDSHGKKYDIDARKVLIVVGGSGISFGLPILRILNYNGINCKLIWVTRDYQDLCLLNYFQKNFAGLEIYITSEEVSNEEDLHIDYVDYEDNDGVYLDMENDNSGEEEHGSREEVVTETLPLHTASEHNYRSINDGNIDEDFSTDEIDFNNSENLWQHNTSTRENSIFRNPSVVVPPSRKNSYGQETRIKVPSGVMIKFGRPTLGNREYLWCLEGECDTSMVEAALNNENDCFDPRFLENGRLESNENIDFISKEKLAKTWVLAAGPQALVESSKRWALERGFQFQQEVYF